MINYDAERGINVTTDTEQRLSDLLIPAASVSHAGNYTCVPNNAVPASIYVHIFNGKLSRTQCMLRRGYFNLRMVYKFHVSACGNIAPKWISFATSRSTVKQKLRRRARDS